MRIARVLFAAVLALSIMALTTGCSDSCGLCGAAPCQKAEKCDKCGEAKCDKCK